jgi:hypothetical protein
MSNDLGRAGFAETGPHASHEAPAGLRPPGFDPARKCLTPGTYYETKIGWDFQRGLTISVVITPPRHKHTRLWQSYNSWEGQGRLIDAVHDALEPILAREMGFVARDSDGPRMAETNEDSARGEAGPARAAESGIAQGQEP